VSSSIRWVTVFLDFPGATFEPGAAFWRAVTGYGQSAARGADGEFATLLPPSGDPYLRLQRTGGGSGGCHLDLQVDTGTESLDAAAGRARAAGAAIRSTGPGLVVLRSPGGFPFCLAGWDGERAVPPPLGAAVAAASEAGQTSRAGRTSGTDLAGPASGVSRVDTVCLDAPPGDYERELAFWAALTGGETRPAPVPGYSYLTGPANWPVRVLVQRRETAAPADRVRAHVDFGSTDSGARDRHVSLGARVMATLPYWTVLTDPAGREYCLVNRDPG
jgi:Glyoxalase-like domain